jgi:hypothetical protein
MASVVEQVANENRARMERSMTDYDFLDEVVRRLRTGEGGTRWGYNGKRSNVNDIWMEGISYYYGPGSAPRPGTTDIYEVFAIDVVHQEPGNFYPDWIVADWPNHPMYNNDGTVNVAYVYPRNSGGTQPEKLLCSAPVPGGGGGPFGTELELFCSLPIKGGYTHDTFHGPDTTRPKLPMVNGRDVMNWPRGWGGIFGTKRVNIQLRCDLIFKSNILDYKGDIPGINTVVEPYEVLPDETEPPEPESGGGGACSDPGTSVANHTGALQSAINAVYSNNPGGIADQYNTRDNGIAFIDYVASELQRVGLNGTSSILNGNGNLNPSGDLIGVWASSDTVMERYDIIESGGAGNKKLRDARFLEFSGDIPLTCVE